MSGHNKWSKIKHKKAATDAQKSKVFSKFVKLIQNESKIADGDTNSPGLKSAIEAAKKANVPKDNIERAVKKGASSDAQNLTGATYETYGPGGVAMIIETLTDNTNRTGGEVKQVLTKNGLALSSPGSASWAFEKSGSGWNPTSFVDIGDEAEKLESIMEALEDNDDVQGVYTNAQ